MERNPNLESKRPLTPKSAGRVSNRIGSWDDYSPGDAEFIFLIQMQHIKALCQEEILGIQLLKY